MENKQVVVFSLENEYYGVEITSVKEIVRYQEITQIPEAPVFVKGIINLRGSIIPVIDLKERFYNSRSIISEETRILVVKINENTIGIIADAVSEVINLAKENIEQTPALLNNFQESSIAEIGKLEDKLLVILDLAKILKQEELDVLNKVS